MSGGSRERSIANLVLHPGREMPGRLHEARRALATQARPRTGSPAQLALRATRPEPGMHAVRLSLAASAAFAWMAAFGATTFGADEPAHPTPPRPTQPDALSVQHHVELAEPELEPAKPPPEPDATPVRRRAHAEPRAPTPDPSSEPSPGKGEPSPAAQAGEAVTAEPNETLDFTGFDMTTGDGPRYAGGVTASSGKRKEAVHAAHVDPHAESGSGSGSGEARYARPVRLQARSWSCPWPSEADMLGIDEQTVELRVTVEPNGHPSEVRVTRNPGHGFASAATRCAREAHFQPARDVDDRPVRAESPPIRVRFTR